MPAVNDTFRVSPGQNNPAEVGEKRDADPLAAEILNSTCDSKSSSGWKRLIPPGAVLHGDTQFLGKAVTCPCAPGHPSSSSISLTWKLMWERRQTPVEERFLPCPRDTLHRLTRNQWNFIETNTRESSTKITELCWHQRLFSERYKNNLNTNIKASSF